MLYYRGNSPDYSSDKPSGLLKTSVGVKEDCSDRDYSRIEKPVDFSIAIFFIMVHGLSEIVPCRKSGLRFTRGELKSQEGERET